MKGIGWAVVDDYLNEIVCGDMLYAECEEYVAEHPNDGLTIMPTSEAMEDYG